jgi:hypothetical protein
LLFSFCRFLRAGKEWTGNECQGLGLWTVPPSKLSGSSPIKPKPQQPQQPQVPSFVFLPRANKMDPHFCPRSNG